MIIGQKLIEDTRMLSLAHYLDHRPASVLEIRRAFGQRSAKVIKMMERIGIIYRSKVLYRLTEAGKYELDHISKWAAELNAKRKVSGVL